MDEPRPMKPPPAPARANPAALNETIERAAAVLATNPQQAERLAQTVLKAAPSDPRAGLILASARRRQGDAKAALAILQPLARAFPRAAQTHYELGATLAALGDTAKAMPALWHAVRLKRELPEAWRTIGELLFKDGDAAGAEKAFAEQARALITEPRLLPAADAMLEGRLEEAQAILRAYLATRPGDVAGLRMLADAYLQQGLFAEAEVLLAESVRRAPSDNGLKLSYAVSLFRQQKAVEAMELVEPLLAANPRDAANRNLMAACLGLIGEDEKSILIYEGLLKEFDRQPKIWLNYAQALKTVGRQVDSVAAYKRCIALAPGMGEAYWGLANLKVASFSTEETAAMKALTQRPDIAAEDRLHLHYALGKALEDQKDYQGSFENYARGSALRHAQMSYDPQDTTRAVARSRSLMTRAFFDERMGFGSPSREPIFILGLPRSGSTLIEQILASHSQVQGTMELPDIGFIARDMDRTKEGYPEALATFDAEALTLLGELYIEDTKIHRHLDRAHFIDKMPNNFFHVGLIHLILPNARIIDARRHPLGTCFSAFKQHFAQGQGFSYSLTDLGRYYSDYVALMAHFDATLPGRVHRVIYEEMVEDTETQIRRLLDYCGLPFEEGCLRFYENDRAVRTVSSEQVRKPIFRDGLDQWRHYEPWLGELKTALGPALESWRRA